MVNAFDAKESDESKALFKWANTVGIKDYLIHIPNGGYRYKREASLLKQMGVRPGVSDYLLCMPMHGFHGMWIELKRKSNNSKLTDLQELFLQQMSQLDYFACWAKGWENAAKFITGYLLNHSFSKAQLKSGEINSWDYMHSNCWTLLLNQQ